MLGVDGSCEGVRGGTHSEGGEVLCWFGGGCEVNGSCGSPVGGGVVLRGMGGGVVM